MISLNVVTKYYITISEFDILCLAIQGINNIMKRSLTQ